MKVTPVELCDVLEQSKTDATFVIYARHTDSESVSTSSINVQTTSENGERVTKITALAEQFGIFHGDVVEMSTHARRYLTLQQSIENLQCQLDMPNTSQTKKDVLRSHKVHLEVLLQSEGDFNALFVASADAVEELAKFGAVENSDRKMRKISTHGDDVAVPEVFFSIEDMFFWLNEIDSRSAMLDNMGDVMEKVVVMAARAAGVEHKDEVEAVSDFARAEASEVLMTDHPSTEFLDRLKPFWKRVSAALPLPSAGGSVSGAMESVIGTVRGEILNQFLPADVQKVVTASSKFKEACVAGQEQAIRDSFGEVLWRFTKLYVKLGKKRGFVNYYRSTSGQFMHALANRNTKLFNTTSPVEGSHKHAKNARETCCEWTVALARFFRVRALKKQEHLSARIGNRQTPTERTAKARARKQHHHKSRSKVQAKSAAHGQLNRSQKARHPQDGEHAHSPSKSGKKQVRKRRPASKSVPVSLFTGGKIAVLVAKAQTKQWRTFEFVPMLILALVGTLEEEKTNGLAQVSMGSCKLGIAIQSTLRAASRFSVDSFTDAFDALLGQVHSDYESEALFIDMLNDCLHDAGISISIISSSAVIISPQHVVAVIQKKPKSKPPQSKATATVFSYDGGRKWVCTAKPAGKTVRKETGDRTITLARKSGSTQKLEEIPADATLIVRGTDGGRALATREWQILNQFPLWTWSDNSCAADVICTILSLPSVAEAIQGGLLIAQVPYGTQNTGKRNRNNFRSQLREQVNARATSKNATSRTKAAERIVELIRTWSQTCMHEVRGQFMDCRCLWLGISGKSSLMGSENHDGRQFKKVVEARAHALGLATGLEWIHFSWTESISGKGIYIDTEIDGFELVAAVYSNSSHFIAIVQLGSKYYLADQLQQRHLRRFMVIDGKLPATDLPYGSNYKLSFAVYYKDNTAAALASMNAQ
jgi:hypothetical protein